MIEIIGVWLTEEEEEMMAKPAKTAVEIVGGKKLEDDDYVGIVEIRGY